MSLGYVLDYRDINDIRNNTSIGYGKDFDSEYSGKKTLRGQYHNLNAIYQRYQGQHLFNAKLSLLTNPGKSAENRLSLFKQNGVTEEGHAASMLKSHEKTAALDLYYRYQMNNGSRFIINVVNTFGSSYSHSSQSVNSIQGSNDFYDVDLRTDNDSYSFIAHTTYATPLRKGTLTFSSRYQYKQLIQTFESDRTKPYSHTENFNAEYLYSTSSIFLSPVLGFYYINQNTGIGPSHNSIIPFGVVSAEWWPQNGKLKGMTINGNLRITHSVPSLGSLTENPSAVDPHVFSIGNKDLSNFWVYDANIQCSYFVPNSRNYFSLIFTPKFSSNKIADVALYNDGNIYIQPNNIGKQFESTVVLRASWYPWKWLEVAPGASYEFTSFDTPNQKVRYRRFSAYLSCVMTFKKLTLQMAAYPAGKSYSGDIFSRVSPQCYVVAQYKLRHWSLGARFNYSGEKEYSKIFTRQFRYYDREDWRPLRNMVSLTATYAFSIGRSRPHARKTLNNSSNDNGLNNLNKVKL